MTHFFGAIRSKRGVDDEWIQPLDPPEVETCSSFWSVKGVIAQLLLIKALIKSFSPLDVTIKDFGFKGSEWLKLLLLVFLIELTLR